MEDRLDAGPRITFTLFSINEPLPPGYRLVTVQEVHDHSEALRRAMPGWEIANLADGSVDGMSYGGCSRLDRRDDVAHQLGIRSSSPTVDDACHNLTTQDSTQELDAGPCITFTLFPTNEPLPPGYRLVTLQEVHDHREALRRAMPGWEIANLADGSVDGMSYGGCSRLDRRDDVGHQLAIGSSSPSVDDACHNLTTQDSPQELDAGPCITFTLFPTNEPLPPGYRLVTLQEVHDHREALRRAMPGWEIANLADGSVDGMSYGRCTRLDRRDDVAHQLAIRSSSPTVDDACHNLTTQDSTQELDAGPRITFTLFPTNEPLPPEYRLVTLQEVHDHREALRRAMPGWEIANLADGSVDGMNYGGCTRLDRREDAGYQLAMQSPIYAKSCCVPSRRVTSPMAQRMLPALLVLLLGILIYMYSHRLGI